MSRRLPSLPAATQHVRFSDLRGAARLAVTGVQQVTRIAEELHAGIAGGHAGRTRGITGMVYRGVQGTTGLVGRGLDAALERLQPRFGPARESSATRDAVLAAINGVVGDTLADTANPLATTMTLCQHGRPVEPAGLAGAGSRVLLLVHGLCMNDRQWNTGIVGGGHGEALAEALGYTAVYLRYNTGRPIASNGRELARRLDDWLAEWPVPVTEIAVVAHSMGGLVMRSACHHAQREQRAWLGRLTDLVFLGTPHHGAPLERAGHMAERALGISRFSAPFGRLARLRSAGITDLRHGRIVDTPASGERPVSVLDEPVPLPPGVRCYAIASTTAEQSGALADQWVGDGLVPLDSALGDHDDPARALGLPADRRRVFHGMGHLALLARPEVTHQLKVWLAANAPPRRAAAGI